MVAMGKMAYVRQEVIMDATVVDWTARMVLFLQWPWLRYTFWTILPLPRNFRRCGTSVVWRFATRVTRVYLQYQNRVKRYWVVDTTEIDSLEACLSLYGGL